MSTLTNTQLLAALAGALASGGVRVVDLTQTLTPEFPQIALPPEMGQCWPFRIEDVRRVHLRDREELFRRMLFNVLCGNRDDHLKNHALLYDAGGWRLSPAFDVVPQTGMAEPGQAIAVGAMGGIPTIENCLSRCGELGLADAAARAIAEQMVARMRSWPTLFRALGVPEATIAHLRRVLAPALASDDADRG